MSDQPEWLQQGQDLLGPLLRDVSMALRGFSGTDLHVTHLPTLALYHLAHSLQTSIDTNREGRHAVAVSLLRHAVESITIVELGLVPADVSYPLLQAWDSGKKSHGELRRALEQTIWPSYGKGLWNEPWAEFFGRLAKAVQPYAHCSPELLQWGLAALSNGSRGRFVAGAGMYDAIKASRLMVFHILVAWTLGRILFGNWASPDSLVKRSDVRRLGRALSECDLLMKEQDWSTQLWPHMFFPNRPNGGLG